MTVIQSLKFVLFFVSLSHDGNFIRIWIAIQSQWASSRVRRIHSKCQSSMGTVTFEVCQGVLCVRKACAVSCKFIIIISSHGALCSSYWGRSVKLPSSFGRCLSEPMLMFKWAFHKAMAIELWRQNIALSPATFVAGGSCQAWFLFSE